MKLETSATYSQEQDTVEALSSVEQDLGPLTWRDYVQVTKPGIVRSNLIVIVTGFWLASAWKGSFDFMLLLYTILGGSLVMAGSCVLNNYLDRDLDIKMERTMERPIATGRMSAKTALGYGMLLIIAGTTVLGLTAENGLAALLGIIGAFFYVVVYTAWMKRTTHLNTVVGAISGAVPPIIGWAAVTGNLEQGAWLLFSFLFLWQIPHFLALAMMKADEYREAGYHMLPVTNGFLETKRQILLWTAALVPVSLFMYEAGIVGKLYFISAAALGLGWLALAVKGFFAKDDMKWARSMFLYSLLYLVVSCVIMMVDVVI
ncbi:protoheme IX farnesyltransferase [Ammoniphilus oxalaticus]|uniref:Protoheme IX farnesyltransferase n=1 Tax=Ammoniphilus oxalaticus TaxID=66863 RepID=A0A419SEI3_9BACL|nr:heme o synthase [Ammoniphilus oxalaticus]RKD21745.1 protoheme IX farnesyltransferase [Ammoniphilus oxalaticus]